MTRTVIAAATGLLIFYGSASALTPEARARLREACERPLREAPAELRADVCGCYVRTIAKRYPNLESENYARIKNDVLRILPDCFAEASARQDPSSVNSKRGWPEKYRTAFITGCRDTASKQSASVEAAARFCQCASRETEKHLPTSLEAETYHRHLLANVPTAHDEKVTEKVAKACAVDTSEESEDVASVEYQIIRYMRKGMTRANAARRVLRGYSGYYMMWTDLRQEAGQKRTDEELARTRGLVAEAGRLYVEACSRCADATACERDRVQVMMPGSEDGPSPCGAEKAPGEQPPPPMSEEERDALMKDAAPYLASMARGSLMGLVRLRRQGDTVPKNDVQQAAQLYEEFCERLATREACAADIDLILAGKAPEKRPWSETPHR